MSPHKQSRKPDFLKIISVLSLWVLSQIATADDSYLDQTRMALKAKQEFFFSLKVSADQPFIYDTPPTGTLGANLEYNFVETYSVGLEFSYKQPFTTDTTNYAGANDLIAYFSDKELYVDHKNKFNISAKVGGVFPTSTRSKNSSLLWGLSESGLVRKGFGNFSLIYGLDIGENFYQYDTTNPSATALASPTFTPRYNSPVSIANRIVAGIKFLRNFNWQSASQIRTSTDFNNSTSSVYSFSTGVSYEAGKNLSFDTGIRTTVKDTGVPATANSNGDTAGGTTTSGGSQYIGDHLFDPYGTLFYFGTTIKI